jgi:hypothetical protein
VIAGDSGRRRAESETSSCSSGESVMKAGRTSDSRL